jgi:Ornithine cyclodeaminase/mu-crystallin family
MQDLKRALCLRHDIRAANRWVYLDGRHSWGRVWSRQLLPRQCRQQAFPTHMAMVLLFQPETGQPLVVRDGSLITEMRTAAVSAAVTNRLASPDVFGAERPNMPSALPRSIALRPWTLSLPCAEQM